MLRCFRLQGPSTRCLRSFTSLNSNLNHLFEQKVQLGKTLPELNDNQQKLKMYALYKQATVGPCTTEKPGMFDMIGKFKWEAWKNLDTLTSEQAKQQYIDMIDSLAKAAGAASEESESSPDILIEKDNGLLSIQLNRPSKFNALNWSMYKTIQESLNEAENDPNVTAVLLAGKGKMFCSGNDLSMFSQLPPGGPTELASQAKDVLESFVDAFITFPKPIVAAVQGPAIGISVTILGLCDLVYAHERATFHTPFAALGQSPEGCSSLLFPALFGPARANSMLLLGQKLTAVEAAQFGLVSETFGADYQTQVDARVKTLLRMPPLALEQSKKLMRSHSIDHLRQVNRKESQLLEKLWIADECMQAAMKFAGRKG